jgi:hypothetical protein
MSGKHLFGGGLQFLPEVNILGEDVIHPTD